MDPKKEKLPDAPDPAEQSRFLRWAENIWYHYKWHILITAFFLFTLAVCLAQCSSREKYDLNVCFAGGAALDRQEQDGLAAVLEAILPEDYDGDGTRSVALVTYPIYSEEQLREMYSFVGEDGEKHFSEELANARAQNADEISLFSSYSMTGECVVWFVSPYLFDQCNLSHIAVPLTDVFGTLPGSAANEYAIRLSGTEFYRYYAAVRSMPEDTLIVLTHPFDLLGQGSKETVYQNGRELFRTIVMFSAP